MLITFYSRYIQRGDQKTHQREGESTCGSERNKNKLHTSPLYFSNKIKIEIHLLIFPFKDKQQRPWGGVEIGDGGFEMLDK